MRFLIEGADDFTQVIHIAVRSLCSCSRFERGGIAAAHHSGEYAYFEERDELLLGIDLTAGRRCGLHAPRGTQDTVTVEREQTGEEARSRCFWWRFQREHLYVAFANLQVVAMPGNGTLDDLPIHAGIAAKLILLRPFLKVEQIAEKLETLSLVQQPQSKRVAKMTLKNDRGLFQVRQHPRGIERILVWLTFESLHL